MLKTYADWAAQRFAGWQKLPEAPEEWSPRAKKIRNSYILLARTILFLFQAAPEMGHEEWIKENTELAYHLNDILALLKDSADWAVIAVAEIEPIFAIAPHEMELLSIAMGADFPSSNRIVAKTFTRTMAIITENAQSNIRLRNAVVRLNWAFLATEDLLRKSQNGDAIAYLKRLRPD